MAKKIVAKFSTPEETQKLFGITDKRANELQEMVEEIISKYKRKNKK